MHRARILLLEDDTHYKESIREYLESKEFTVDTCSNGEEFIDTIFNKIYDLYIIDINVPKINGLELMRILQECNDTTMKLVLSSSKNYILQSFRQGCDDYITKEIDLEELLLRVSNLIKRSYHTHNDSVPLNDNMYYDIFHKQLYKNGFQIEMENKTVAVLDYLIKNRGVFITKEDLEKNIYSSCSECKKNVLRYHIHNLRKAIGNSNIISEYKKGYMILPYKDTHCL